MSVRGCFPIQPKPKSDAGESYNTVVLMSFLAVAVPCSLEIYFTVSLLMVHLFLTWDMRVLGAGQVLTLL